MYLIRKFKKDQWNENLYELIGSLISISHLAYTQLATVYTLAFQQRGRDILCNVLFSHYVNKSSTDETGETHLKLPDDDVFVACLWALSQKKVDGTRSEHQQLQNYLCNVWRTSDAAAACFLSHTLRVKESFELLQVRLSVNVHYLYKLLLINTSYLFEWEEREDWVNIFLKLLEHNWSELGQRFISDFYTFLCANSNMIMTFPQPLPSFYKIVEKFIGEKPSVFNDAMNGFGKQKFQKVLYEVSKKSFAAQRMTCIIVYSLFREVTIEFIDMVFTACLDDFTLCQHNALQCCNDMREVEDRAAIESVVTYLKSPSMLQRYLAAKFLVKFVLLGFLSANEVIELLEDVINDPTSIEALTLRREIRGKSLNTYIRSLLLSMTCLEPIDEDRSSLSLITPEEIGVNFSESLEMPFYSTFNP